MEGVGRGNSSSKGHRVYLMYLETTKEIQCVWRAKGSVGSETYAEANLIRLAARKEKAGLN